MRKDAVGGAYRGSRYAVWGINVNERSHMTPLRRKLIEELKFRRCAPNTERTYVGAVVRLAGYHHQSPDKLTPQQIRDYIRHLQVERKLAWSSVNVAVCAINFFWSRVLRRKWPIQNLPPQKRPTKPPEILSCEELERLFEAAKRPSHRTLLMTTYAAGLRVSEVVRLQACDILSDRMQIRVVESKGNKGRYTTLSPSLLKELRKHWARYRPERWLFPGNKPGRHLSPCAAQDAYRNARKGAGIERGAGIHSLRHAFATHLLESGVDVRTIQILLGHSSISSTMRYLTVTRQRISKVKSPFDLLGTGCEKEE